MDRKLVLLVEDDVELQDVYARLLKKKGFIVEAAVTLAEAGAAFERCSPDIIILDRGMPDGEGLDFLREIRDGGDMTPVLVLTGYKEDQDIIDGYETGCDDYLVKPYTFGVMLAKINRLLENAQRLPENIVKGKLKLNIASAKAFVDEEDLDLSRKEFSLLCIFASSENRVFQADFLYGKVWGQEMVGHKQAVQSAISRLRKKLEPSGYTINGVYGEGYVFELS